jgi:hypothetical protein
MNREKLDEMNKVSMEIDRLKSKLQQVARVRRSCSKSLQIHYVHTRTGNTTGIFNLSDNSSINKLLAIEEGYIKEELSKQEKIFEAL